MNPPRPLWDAMNSRPRVRASACRLSDVPSAPGVYAWYRSGEPIYVGRAIADGGLRKRLRRHLATVSDLSHSAFRRNVCDHLGIASTGVTRVRPPLLVKDQVDAVNAWVAECEIAWVECATRDGAAALETAMKGEWKPPLTRR